MGKRAGRGSKQESEAQFVKSADQNGRFRRDVLRTITIYQRSIVQVNTKLFNSGDCDRYEIIRKLIPTRVFQYKHVKLKVV